MHTETFFTTLITVEGFRLESQEWHKTGAAVFFFEGQSLGTGAQDFPC
jgi:hypothetical protein